MKKQGYIQVCAKSAFMIMTLICVLLPAARCQSAEAEQLLLNVEKLAQLKQILNDMYKGYEVVSKGYNTIKDISEGNFSLHKVFLDALMQVSPVVRKYKKVGDIIAAQGQIVKEYKNAFRRFVRSEKFNAKEIQYISNVYSGLLSRSADNLNDLLLIITDNQLRMSDEERLAAIDGVFERMQDKLSFVRHFNQSTSVLAVQRSKETAEINASKRLFGIH